jgi:hypothetical protein
VPAAEVVAEELDDEPAEIEPGIDLDDTVDDAPLDAPEPIGAFEPGEAMHVAETSGDTDVAEHLTDSTSDSATDPASASETDPASAPASAADSATASNSTSALDSDSTDEGPARPVGGG